MLSSHKTPSHSFWQKTSNFITLNFKDSIDEAACYQDWETVKAILKAGGNPDDVSTFDNSALYTAILYRNYEVMILLLDAKADPNFVPKEKKHPCSTLEPPLNLAMSHHTWPAVKLLLFNGAQPDIKNQFGKTLIESASWKYSPEGLMEKARIVTLFAEAKQFMKFKTQAANFEFAKNAAAAALNFHEAGKILEKIAPDNESVVQNYSLKQALNMYRKSLECIEKFNFTNHDLDRCEEIILALPQKIGVLEEKLGSTESDYKPTPSQTKLKME